MSSIWYINDEGQCVQLRSGSLMINGVEIPCIDGKFQLPETPLMKMIAEHERDLLDRYHRGEFDEGDE